ncbi:MAG: peptidylprolyl isomerase [Oligoflexia bacterium]|nr:peptidylprolyl isomerase [Oligoflexia bacterium]
MPALPNSKAQVISFRCILKTQLGELICSSFNREVWSDEPTQNTGRLPALTRGLRNLQTGEKRCIAVPADQAYGLYDKSLVLEVSRSKFANQGRLEIGQEVIVETQSGEQRPFRVTGLTGKRVTLDGNHPLAGQDLIFDIEATEVRDATSEEITRELGRAGEMSLAHPKWGLLH